MRPALRPGTTVLRRDRTHLQLGTTPGRGYVLRDRPGLVELLRILDGVRDLTAITELVAAEIPQLTGDPVAVIAELHAAHLLVDASCWPGRRDDALAAEARHLSAQGWSADEVGRRLDRRRSALVEILADDGTAALAAAVRDLLVASGVRAHLEPVDEPTFVIVTATSAGARTTLEIIAENLLPHLVVQAEQDGVEVGPLVVPGTTACVGCADLQRADWDPYWLALLAQVDRPLARAAECGAAAMSAVTAHAAAIEAVTQVLGHLDRTRPVEGTEVVLVGPGPGEIERHGVEPHTRCSCQVLRVLAPAATMET